MPVGQLLVEGKLDFELWRPICGGRPRVSPFLSGKHALKPRTRTARQEGKQDVYYLRDRDFDFDPPQDCSRPVTETDRSGAILGWHWCRHEIENYLLEPRLVAAALGLSAVECGVLLCAAATEICFYQAARWAVGVARRSLPPNYELRTRPEEVGDNDYRLPKELSAQGTAAWAMQVTADFCQRASDRLAAGRIQTSLHSFQARFCEKFCSDPNQVLLWFSGKDLFAALGNPDVMRCAVPPGISWPILRDWVTANSDQTLQLLLEWAALRDNLRAAGPV